MAKTRPPGMASHKIEKKQVHACGPLAATMQDLGLSQNGGPLFLLVEREPLFWDPCFRTALRHLAIINILAR